MDKEAEATPHKTAIHVRASEKGIEVFTEQVYWLLEPKTTRQLISALVDQLNRFNQEFNPDATDKG